MLIKLILGSTGSGCLMSRCRKDWPDSRQGGEIHLLSVWGRELTRLPLDWGKGLVTWGTPRKGTPMHLALEDKHSRNTWAFLQLELPVALFASPEWHLHRQLFTQYRLQILQCTRIWIKKPSFLSQNICIIQNVYINEIVSIDVWRMGRNMYVACT